MSYSILPADRYKVINKTILSEVDRQNLMNFYGPIIGSLSVSLYLVLWQDLNKFSEESEYLLHHHLMSVLKCSAKNLKEAREALEAVGLIKSFVKEENVLVYIYELYSPLYPSEFLNHPILSVVLYNNIGSEEYEKILKQYQKKKYDYSGFLEITKNMDEVYKSESFNQVEDVKERAAAEIKLTSKMDYDLIAGSIPKDTLSDKAFNKKTKELIDNLSFIYDVDTLKMIEYIRMSINEFGMIDKTTLRNTVRKYYQLSSNSLPTIVYRTQPEFLKKASGDTSLRGQIVAMFENVSPYDYLKNKNKGASPTSKDLKLVESLLVDLELTPAVVNVLLDYCLKKNNNKLTTGYVEAVAAQWKRADLKTAEEAMAFAEKEHKKSLKKATEKEKSKAVEPAWFNKNIEKTEVSEQEAEELQELLKEFK
ncbi:MAG: DnaD domain protein [Bacilli bacterium]|nr:DnaD domain protein [Bacilli bacterium]